MDKRLVAKAEALGIDVDGRWSAEALKAEIAKAEKKAADEGDTDDAATDKDGDEAGEGQTLPVKLVRNYRPEDGGDKCVKGAEIDLPADEARKVVRAGIAERNDDFGG